MNEPKSDLARDLKALQYIDALHARDLEAVAALWDEASRDPELERVLAELEGALFAAASNLGGVPQPANPISGSEPLLYRAGDQAVKFMLTRDPKFDPLQFDPKKYKSRIATVASIMDVTDVSLEKFRAKAEAQRAAVYSREIRV